MIYRISVEEMSETIAMEYPQYSHYTVLNTVIETTDEDYILYVDTEYYNGSIHNARLIVTRCNTYREIRHAQDIIEDILYYTRNMNEGK